MWSCQAKIGPGDQIWSPKLVRGPVLAAKIGPPWLNLVPPGPVLVAKLGPGDQFWLPNLVRRTIFSAVSAERCPYGKDGVPHPSICMYLRTLRNLSFQKFSSPDVLQYSYLTCQVSCTIGLPTDNINNANLSHDQSGRSVSVKGNGGTQ